MADLSEKSGWCAVPAGVLAVVIAGVPFIPPLASWATRDAWAEAVSFAVFAIVVPALVVVAAPWRLIGLGGFTGRLADSRRRHPEVIRAGAIVFVAVATDVAWRTPYAVDHLAGDRWLVVVEAATLIATGTALWLELVDSPPLEPRSSRPTRIAIAAVSMWTIWILAYVLGMATTSPYAVYRLSDGRASQAIDSQVATGLLWFIAACAFVPVVFSNLMKWLRSEENPDEELHRLLTEERRRGRGAG